MYLSLVDIDEESKDLTEVISPKIIESGKFSKFGLFSQQIFGPVKSDSCACNRITYRGRTLRNTVCERCGVDIASSEERRKRFAKIILPFPVLNPLFYHIIIKSKSSARTILNNMLNFNEAYYINEKRLPIKIIPGEYTPQDADKLIGLEGTIKYIVNELECNDTNEFKFIRDNFDKVIINNVLIIPPDFRPCGSNGTGKIIMDEINSLYRLLIVRSNQMKALPFSVTKDDDIYKTNFKQIQTIVTRLFEFVLGKMSKKEGLIRSNILGKRVDFSGRAVISPDPTLKLDQCRIPYKMILEILKPQLVTYLVNRRVCKRYNQAVKLVEDCIRTKSEELFDLCVEFCRNKMCILNRQPTLHRLSILAFKVSIHLGNTIQIHPMVCHPFNADFDGDSCNADFELICNGQTINIGISELKNRGDLFVQYKTKNRDDGVIVTKYKPKCEIKIKAIDTETGNIEYKNITEYSVHKNLDMYKIHDNQNRFKDFHASYDHSLIVYDERKEEIKIVTPRELIKDPVGKYILKGRT